ncbi:glycosyltransferase family 4 protein [Mucilaginibacter gotjawali]|nr:glycosyltransferase family 1 protein [Mucilaginibacter gotjawali]MBB3058532.1 glycosyltransferase involved in cell wall biosynthesis [Mucilaginibacter gotjawali]
MIYHSGIGKYLRMLLPFIIKEYDVTLLGNPEQLAQFTPPAKVIAFNAPIYSIGEQIQLPKLVSHADIFWSPHYNVPLLGIKCEKKVVTIHDVYHLAFYKDLSLKQKLYAKVVINNAVKTSDAIITVSDFSKSEIIKYTACNPGKIAVIYNGVEQSVTNVNPGTVREKYQLPAKYILFVGNVKPHKNLKTLLKAFLLLNERFKSIYKIVIAGKKDGFITGDRDLIDWVNANDELRDRVVFTGYIDNDDMNGIYLNASLFVFPTVYEGFGLPPLEAMLNSCPVIASNASCIPEVCGQAALYFDPMNEYDLKNAIEKVLTDKATMDEMVNEGLERIKLFDWKNAADSHIRLFNQIIEN